MARMSQPAKEYDDTIRSFWARTWSFQDRANDPETESEDEGELTSPLDNLANETANLAISENQSLSNRNPNVPDEDDQAVGSIEVDPSVPPDNGLVVPAAQLPPSEVVQVPETPVDFENAWCFDQELHYFGNNVNLTEMLRCPICYEIMLPPIALCVEGHSICTSCKNRLEKCPICQATFAGTRNRIAEDLVGMCIIQCKFKSYGCNAKLRGDQLGAHQNQCNFRLAMEAAVRVEGDNDGDDVGGNINDWGIMGGILFALNRGRPRRNSFPDDE